MLAAFAGLRELAQRKNKAPAPAGACRECRDDYGEEPPDCCRRRLPRRSRWLWSRPYGVDLISALPDDLLLHILARLRCARAAAHTSLVSRRWRGLWTRLPELSFHCVTTEQLHAALAQVICPAPSLLEINFCDHQELREADLSALFRDAARLAPEKLHVSVQSDEVTVELPSFHRTVSINLDMPLAGGHFPALENLFLSVSDIDLADLLLRCPRLRRLQIHRSQLSSIVVHSPSLQELEVQTGGVLQHVDILAPSLKKLKFEAINEFNNEFTLLYSAPGVEELSWQCSYHQADVGFGHMWRLWTLRFGTPRPCPHSESPNTSGDTSLQLQRVLSLEIVNNISVLRNASRSFGQVISNNSVTHFSVMELDIRTQGHIYGAVVLHLLGLCPFIQRLEVKLIGVECKACSVDCPCDQPNNWRSQNVSLTHLKEFEIEGIKGEEHEFDLLKAILRNATMLERMTVKFSYMVSRSCFRSSCFDSSLTQKCYRRIHSISKAYPSLEWSFDL